MVAYKHLLNIDIKNLLNDYKYANKACSHQYQGVCTQQNFTTKMGVGVISKSSLITLCMAIEDSERFQL